MTIIIPMAGLSSRFSKAGYVLPKYMLYVRNRSMFNLSVSSFEKYFVSCKFLFIARNIFDTSAFIERECELMGIKDYEIVILDSPTRGQAETVLKGIEKSSIDRKDSILIFNIDTIRPNFVFPENLSNSDGYLECFEGNGANWSYAKTEDGLPMSKVVKTAEKEEISNYCSTGIYYFKTAQTFINAYNENEKHPLIGEIKELYVAPLYNYLINDKCDIRINVIKKDEVIFSGVPEEYDTLLINSLKV